MIPNPGRKLRALALFKGDVGTRIPLSTKQFEVVADQHDLEVRLYARRRKNFRVRSSIFALPAPLDKIVIEELSKFGFPALTCVSSHLAYPEYFEQQKWIRNKFVLVPLDVEFLVWLGKAIETKYLRRTDG